MKRIFSLLLVFVLFLSTTMLMVSCGDASKGLVFESNGDGTCTVQMDGSSRLFGTPGVDLYTGELVIPETSPEGDRVTSIDAGGFIDDTGLTSIIIPDSVTEIGSDAFRGCTGLTNLIIPDSVISIGGNAFEECNGLEFNEYDGMRYFGKALITPLDKTKSTYKISDNTKIICGEAFAECENLTSITIPNGVISVGNHAFFECTALTAVKISDSVISIGDYAFSDCRALTAITIPDSVTSIGDGAFSDCRALTAITIPDSVTSIGDSAFSDCRALTAITIPDSVTSIGNRVFYNCSNLTSIIIPNSVTSIGEFAFYDCYSFTDVYFTGTEQEWAAISVGANNDPLLNATIHYNYVLEE